MTMTDRFYLHGKAILPDSILDNAYVGISDSRIATVSPAHPEGSDVKIIDAGDNYISPGFVDIHVHGGDGADYMDGTTEAVLTANRAHLRHGATTVFPTTTTGSPQQLQRMIDACLAVQKSWTPNDGARIAGIHFYGPYFAEDKVGCHSPEGRRDPDPAEYLHFLSLGIIRIATCAAELPGAVSFYRAAREHDCLITCGHSNASWTEMQRAFNSGMRHVDHFWCAMSSVPSVRARFGFPMQGGMEQFVLANREMTTEVIADGQHLSPELLEFAYRMKGPAHLCLVTDSSRALDMPPGHYRFGCKDDGPWFESNGQVGLAPQGGLASSIMGLDTMVRNMAAQTSAPLYDVIRMASLTPAALTGISREAGSIEPGKRADLLLLTPDLHLSRVYLGGLEAYSATPASS